MSAPSKCDVRSRIGSPVILFPPGRRPRVEGRSAPAPVAEGCIGPARLTVRRNELFVEVQSDDALELVDQALIEALLSAGLAAEKEGPRIASAVAPPICYGKVRVCDRGEQWVREHLAAARAAALEVLSDAGCDVPEDEAAATR